MAGYLKDFLFDPNVLEAKIETFSGGERSRLLLAREFARPSNLLILDEPTNDLDLETLDLLQEVIDDYAGTVLIVSHDRDFLDRTVTMVVALDAGEGGGVDVVAGVFGLEAKRREDLRPIPTPTPASIARDQAANGPRKPQVKLTYIEGRELGLLPGQIDALHGEITTIEAALADPKLYTADFEAVREADEDARCDARQARRRRRTLARTRSQSRRSPARRVRRRARHRARCAWARQCGTAAAILSAVSCARMNCSTTGAIVSRHLRPLKMP